MSNIVSYAREMSESLYVAAVSPLKKSLSEEFGSTFAIISFKMSKSEATVIFLCQNSFLLRFFGCKYYCYTTGT